MVFKLNTDGTGFAVLKHFTGLDGRHPYAGLTLSGGVLYGTTVNGGSANHGTVFRCNTSGTGYAVIRHFTGANGSEPYAGGSWNNGTAFKIDLADGLNPIPLTAQIADGAIILHWSDPAFALQTAPTVTGNFTNVAGATSPYTNAIIGPQQFFRLIGN